MVFEEIISDKGIVNVWLDLETLSRDTDAAVICVSAVAYEMRNCKSIGKFSVNITHASAKKLGNVSKETIEWWKKQPKEYRDRVKEGAIESKEAWQYFADWFKSGGDDKQFIVWGNGPAFDIGKSLRHLELLGIERPWKHYNERCCHTVEALTRGYVSRDDQRLKYDSLENALYKANYSSKMAIALRESIAIHKDKIS
jgi:hypothetical protein